jgi:hypothetical protein
MPVRVRWTAEDARKDWRMRQPSPIRRLSPEEIRAIEHKRNMELYLRKQKRR